MRVCYVRFVIGCRKIIIDDPRFNIRGDVIPLKNGEGLEITVDLYNVYEQKHLPVSMNSHDYRDDFGIPSDASDTVFSLLHDLRKDFLLFKRLVSSDPEEWGTFDDLKVDKLKKSVGYICGSYYYSLIRTDGKYTLEPFDAPESLRRLQNECC